MTLWILTIPVTYVALFPVSLAGQSTPTPGGPDEGDGVGTSVQTPLRFAGESAPANQFSLGMGASSLYDDNVFQNNSDRVSDEAVSFSSNLNFSRQTERLTLSFEFSPFFVLYRQTDQLDRLNYIGNVSLTYRLSSRFTLGLDNTSSYQDGFYQSFNGPQMIVSGLASPTALNLTIYPYTVRTLSSNSGLHLRFAKSWRTAFTISGGYSLQEFGNQRVAGQQLYNSRGVNGGLQYQYRVTEHTTFGLLMLHQDSTYTGGGAFGTNLRFQSESALVSVGSRLSPSVTVNFFGGPQYVRIIGASPAGAGTTEQILGAGGGSITKEVQKTAIDLSVQRTVTGGNGLYTLVKSTTAGLGVRRRVVGRWEANLSVDFARADASLFQLASGWTDALIGGFGLNRPLTKNATLNISYNAMHQMSYGNLPISANFDRNLVTIGINYQLKAISLGR